MRTKLDKHLSILKRQGVINGWHYRQIVAGTEWRDEIDNHLESARVILLLISSDFLASDYCYEIEAKRALERHEAKEARVIPVILRPCMWERSPFGKLLALPKDARPVTQWNNLDEAFTDIARGIVIALNDLPPPLPPRSGCAVVNRQSSTVNTMPKKHQRTIRVDALLENFDAKQIPALLELLKDLSGDASLRIMKIEEGSVLITIEASEEALKRLETLAATGELSRALGYEASLTGKPSRYVSLRIARLIVTLRDRDVRVCIASANALGQLGPAASEAVPALIVALRDGDVDVRSAAANALGQLGPAAVPALIEALRDWRDYVRSAAASALGQLGPAASEAVPALIEVLRDRDVRVCIAAASALEKVGPAKSEAVPALIEALRDWRDYVRSAAAKALGQLGPAASEAVPALIEVLRDGDSYVRFAATEALRKVGPDIGTELGPF